MAKIQKTFTYDVPDDYLHQTRTLNKIGVWTYDGPDKIWAFVDKETNKLTCEFKTPEEDGADYPTPLHLIKVEIDCNENPLLPCLLGADEVRDYNLLDQHEETLPDGTVYVRPLVPPPDHTYEVTDIVYDPISETFKTPYPWKQPHMSWEEIRKWRNRVLASSDTMIIDDVPSALKAKWEEYRQKLRELPQVHGAAPGELPDTDPWKIKPVPSPDGTE